MGAENIETRVDGHVLVITVARAEKRNAFDRGMLGALASAYDRLSTDDELRCGVVVASGDHFSAGLDLLDVGPAVAAGESFIPAGVTDPFGLWGPACTKPVVVALKGVSFTLSIELALGADVVVVGDDVRLAQMEVARGILPFGGATIRAAAQLGWGNAMRFLLTAEEFGAEEALRIGLAQEVVEPGAVDARAVEIAHVIAAQAPLGVQATLRQSRLARDEGVDAAVADLKASMGAIMNSADASEGIAAFVERRPGNWSGS